MTSYVLLAFAVANLIWLFWCWHEGIGKYQERVLFWLSSALVMTIIFF